jgi:hypothetical protein
MSSDAEYVLSGLRREYESLSNDVFALRNDVYFLTQQLQKEITFSEKLISVIQNSMPHGVGKDILDAIMLEFGRAKNTP